MDASQTEDFRVTVKEEPYTQKNEALLKEWMDEARSLSSKHNEKGRYYKYWHERIGFPATLLPVVYSPISGLLSNEPNIEIANVAVLITTGVLTGIHTFFDLGRKSQLHFDYENRYMDVCTTIRVELEKEPRFRMRCDRFIEIIHAKMDNLGASAPLL